MQRASSNCVNLKIKSLILTKTLEFFRGAISDYCRLSVDLQFSLIQDKNKSVEEEQEEEIVE